MLKISNRSNYCQNQVISGGYFNPSETVSVIMQSAVHHAQLSSLQQELCELFFVANNRHFQSIITVIIRHAQVESSAKEGQD